MSLFRNLLRHKQKLDCGTDDLKQKKQVTTHNTTTMVTLLCRCMVSRKFRYCFIYSSQPLLYCFVSWLYCCGLCNVTQSFDKILSKLLPMRNFFCLHANTSTIFINIAVESLFGIQHVCRFLS